METIVTLHLDPFHHIIIENLYDKNQLNWIWAELNLFTREGVLVSPNEITSASDSKGMLRTNKTRFLDDVYDKSRDVSAILTYNRKIFQKEILNQTKSWFFSTFKPTHDTTLLGYYREEDFYASHHDIASCTALTWFYKEPKKFEGGDLIFSDYGVEVKCKNNCGIIFPSMVMHEVSKINSLGEELGSQWGRFCISQFMRMV